MVGLLTLVKLSFQGHKVKVAMLLSELVIYTASRKFVSFEDSREKQKFYQNNSIGEVKGQKLIKKKGNFKGLLFF